MEAKETEELKKFLETNGLEPAQVEALIKRVSEGNYYMEWEELPEEWLIVTIPYSCGYDCCGTAQYYLRSPTGVSFILP